jgi:hypothetical protein
MDFTDGHGKANGLSIHPAFGRMDGYPLAACGGSRSQEIGSPIS